VYAAAAAAAAARVHVKLCNTAILCFCILFFARPPTCKNFGPKCCLRQSTQTDLLGSLQPSYSGQEIEGMEGEEWKLERKMRQNESVAVALLNVTSPKRIQTVHSDET